MMGRSACTRSRKKREPDAFARTGSVKKRFSGRSSTRGRKCENVTRGSLEADDSAAGTRPSLSASTALATDSSFMESDGGKLQL